ncbi:MAG: EAL and HDOD domain-containing protein [Fimbriimonadales bacterium]
MGTSQYSDKDLAFFMARQPIYDRSMKLFGYELLYRRSSTSLMSGMDAQLELSALSNILVEVGLDRLSRNHRAFVNVPTSLLGSDALRLLPNKRVVLEILEDTPWTEEVERNLRDLKKLGYCLALDDYTFAPEHEPFLNHVDIVKVDVLGVHPDRLRANMTRIRRAGQAYLAEKVETHTTVEFCRVLGFDYFQGYFIAKPKTIRGTGIPANHALSIALLGKLNDPDVSLDELEKLLAANVVICHKVLRLVNSVAMGLARKVDSMRQAMIYLGTSKIRTLATLAVTTSIPGKPPELYALAMIRANYCEALARSAGLPDPEKHFLVGLLSVLEALTDVAIKDLVAELPIAPEISAALCGAANSPCSITLQHVFAVERGDWQTADAILRNVPPQLYVYAVETSQRDEQLLAA